MVASKLLKGNARRSGADFGYHDLQSIYNSEDGSQETSDKVAPVLTQTDTQVKAAKHLFVTSARFRNAAKVLKDICAGHMAIDLECFTESDGLLASHTTNFFHASCFPDREGCYLHYDKNRGCFVRSDKVNGRRVSVRDSEHLVGAKARSASSHFYRMYPSSESPRATKRGKQGLFENLQQIIAAGYDPSSDLAQNLHKDWNKGGLLILSEEEKKEIKGSMGKKLTYMNKFHYIVSYQLEFGYDLAICPGLNVSRSPGFESVLGVFGGDD